MKGTHNTSGYSNANYGGYFFNHYMMHIHCLLQSAYCLFIS